MGVRGRDALRGMQNGIRRRLLEGRTVPFLLPFFGASRLKTHASHAFNESPSRRQADPPIEPAFQASQPSDPHPQTHARLPAVQAAAPHPPPRQPPPPPQQGQQQPAGAREALPSSFVSEGAPWKVVEFTKELNAIYRHQVRKSTGGGLRFSWVVWDMR